MGFFQTLKKKLGIGGVKVALQVPGHVDKDAEHIEGKLSLTTKSEQEIVYIEFKLVEKYTRGRGDSKSTTEFTLGEIKNTEAFTLKPGETREVPFILPFVLLKSRHDKLKEKGGASATVGKLGAFANAEKSDYFVQTFVDVKGVVLDPTDTKRVKLV